MSSRIIIRTLKFCTSSVENLEQTLRLNGIDYERKNDVILVRKRSICLGGGYIYMNVESTDIEGIELFNELNAKLSSVEEIIREQELSRLERERERAIADEESYRVRRIKTEQERLRYEAERLRLEKQNFTEAKKQAIIDKAKSMGYSVREYEENGTVKLKLVKRIY